MTPLIAQEALAYWSRSYGHSALHFWSHRQAVLLGQRDSVLPDAEKAISTLQSGGYAVAVRPFGGLAVPLDEDCVNVSWITPSQDSLDAHFSVFAQRLLMACARFGQVKVGEVAGSYCPGRFDLAIKGVKFAGIAQRRLAGVTIVSAFVNVGANSRRERVVSDFYKEAVPQEKRTQFAFVPTIRLGAVQSLEELSGVRVTSEDFIDIAIREQMAQEPALLAEPCCLDDFYAEAEARLKGRNALREWEAFAKKE